MCRGAPKRVAGDVQAFDGALQPAQRRCRLHAIHTPGRRKGRDRPWPSASTCGGRCRGGRESSQPAPCVRHVIAPQSPGERQQRHDADAQTPRVAPEQHLEGVEVAVHAVLRAQVRAVEGLAVAVGFDRIRHHGGGHIVARRCRPLTQNRRQAGVIVKTREAVDFRQLRRLSGHRHEHSSDGAHAGMRHPSDCEGGSVVPKRRDLLRNVRHVDPAWNHA
mmetsp:Transcript_12381/g.38510  ORF Transcript_12381/g.38510 Transcript_12381/m.38510 type:complete len:219 (-) Transcript_12381:68-724(-)